MFLTSKTDFDVREMETVTLLKPGKEGLLAITNCVSGRESVFSSMPVLW